MITHFSFIPNAFRATKRPRGGSLQMLFDFTSAESLPGDALIQRHADPRWGVDSEYGRLLDVLVAAPSHLEIVPCNSVSVEALANGILCCTDTAGQQHASFIRALEDKGVACHLVEASASLPDLTFTRDAVLMSPWGMIELKPRAEHRADEVAHLRTAIQQLGIRTLGRIEEGSIEGGDVCILRPGVVAIGYSGERTDEKGARALARLFEARGWRAIFCRFNPYFLHLDTLFTVVDRNRAVACIEELEPAFLDQLAALGIDLIPASVAEVKRLGTNLVSLGAGRVLSPADNGRINGELERLGYEVVPVDVDQFTRCGGGVHCLTMPLSRLPG